MKHLPANFFDIGGYVRIGAALRPIPMIALAGLTLSGCGGGGSSSSSMSSGAALAATPSAVATASGSISRSGEAAVTPAASGAESSATLGAAGQTLAPAASAKNTPAAVVAATPPPAAAPAAATKLTVQLPALHKSISNWVTCAGLPDETAAVAKAVAAARNAAFTLVVDCPVNLKIGTDITKPIFIDDGTSVEFTGSGKFVVDNVQIPAFVIADSSNINLINWNVEYVGSLPVDEAIGYEYDGVRYSGKAGNAFNDNRLTNWLVANKALVRDNVSGVVHSLWPGTTNACAVFYFTGDASNVVVSGLHLYVPSQAGGDRFIPVAFTLAMNYRAHQTVNARTAVDSRYMAVPHDLLFSNVTLDGTYMGWVGGLRNTVFENITSLRYGDLQDASGNHVGGLDKWFAPPHLFYFNYPLDADSGLWNSNLQFSHVTDSGIRVGRARDAGGSDTVSGYANSLKLSCVNCSVDTYSSARPDGLMDVLTSDGLAISNVVATYNSKFTHDMYPGVRFPNATYKNVKLQNVSLTDTAASTIQNPIGHASSNDNVAFTITGVQVNITKWDHDTAVFPSIGGQDNNLSFKYTVAAAPSGHSMTRASTVEAELSASPTTLRAGGSVALNWLSHGANSCSGAGAMGSSVNTSGNKSVRLTAAGAYNFTISCRNSSNVTTSTVSVTVQP